MHPRVQRDLERRRQRRVVYQAKVDEHNRSAAVFDVTVGPLFGALDVASLAAANLEKLFHAKRKHESNMRASGAARQAERASALALSKASAASATSNRAAKASRVSYDNAILGVRESMVSPHPRGRPS
jgi:hypothetical protein